MVVVPLGILITMKMISVEVFAECREKAREMTEGEKPVSRAGAIVVFTV